MMRRWDLSVAQRLAIGSGIVILLVVVQGAVTVRESAGVRALQERQREIVEPRSRAAQALETAVLEAAVSARNFALSPGPSELQAFERAASVMARRLETLQALPKDRDGEALFERIVPRAAEFQRAVDRFVRLSAGVGPTTEVHDAEQGAGAARKALLAGIAAYTELQAEKVTRASAAIAEAMDRLVGSIATAVGAVLLIAVCAALAVARSVRDPARQIVTAANAMVAGDFEPALALKEAPRRRGGSAAAFRDELREAASVFGRMALTLRDRERRLAGQGQLAAVLASNLSPVELATDALRELTRYLGAEVAAVYVADVETEDGDELRPLATFAVEQPLRPVRIGEGLPGQAVADQRTVLVTDIPADTLFTVDVGLAAFRPRWVAAVPLNVGKRVLGVLVVASVHDLSPDALSFLEESASQLAVSLDNALAHVRIEALAATLQEQNERLQAQNEELQAQGEELQAQAEELQAQAEELQAQTEELQAQGEELQTQTEELRGHRDLLEVRNERLAEAEAHKDRFLAVLGHELRNPLSAVTAAVEVLRRSADDEAAAAARDVLVRQSRQLARLLDDLLETTRISSGKITLLRRPIDLAQVVSQAVATSMAGATRHTARVHAEAVWVDADPVRLEQIVTNLLGNALKYTPDGGAIVVSVGREADEAALRVIDTGIGIPPALLPRIFEPFVQEGPTRVAGLGLGLTLVRQLVELHGGSVTATSPGRDRGTTVTVRLPTCPPPAAFEPAPAAVAAVSSPKRSVLLIEDNADARMMLRTLLGQQGHTVHEASDGPTGVAAALATRPDIVFVDLDLPGFDGYEVVRRLRAQPEGRELLLIALSGYGGHEVRQRALEAGFDEQFVKPIEADRLTALLRDRVRD